MNPCLTYAYYCDLRRDRYGYSQHMKYLFHTANIDLYGEIFLRVTLFIHIRRC